MVEDMRLIDWIMGGLLASLGVACKWIVGDMKLDITKNKASIEQLAKEHAQYQLYVANHYPGEDTVKRIWATLEKMDDKLNALTTKKTH